MAVGSSMGWLLKVMAVGSSMGWLWIFRVAMIPCKKQEFVG